MVSMFTSSAVYHELEARSGQNKDYKIGICCFSTNDSALRRKSKDRLALNQDNMSEWSDMSTHGLLIQWASNTKIQLIMLVKYKADIIIIWLTRNLFSQWYSWKIDHFVLNNNHSLILLILFHVYN
jgi:hypothetical protein